MKSNLSADIVFRHHVSIQTRFSDVDPLGHVNNSMLFQYFDCGRIRYLQEILPQNILWNEVPLVLVHLSTDFLQPVFFDVRLAVETKTLGFGKKSMKMIQRLIDEDSGEVKSTCQAVLSGFNPKDNSSVVISEELKQIFRNYEQDIAE